MFMWLCLLWLVNARRGASTRARSVACGSEGLPEVWHRACGWMTVQVAFCTAEYGNLRSGCTVSDLVGGCMYTANLLLSFQVRPYEDDCTAVTPQVWYSICSRVPCSYLRVSARRVAVRLPVHADSAVLCVCAHTHTHIHTNAHAHTRVPQIGVVATHGYRKRTVMDGRTVAWLYMRYGRFWMDAIAAVPFIYLVRARRQGFVPLFRNHAPQPHPTSCRPPLAPATPRRDCSPLLATSARRRPHLRTSAPTASPTAVSGGLLTQHRVSGLCRPRR